MSTRRFVSLSRFSFIHKRHASANVMTSGKLDLEVQIHISLYERVNVPHTLVLS